LVRYSTEANVKFADVAETIVLPDNGGYGRMKLIPRSIDDERFIANVSIAYRFLDEAPSSRLRLAAVSISRARFAQLERLLAVWLEHRTPFEINLSSHRNGVFRLTVGPDSDYISSLEKPAFRIDIDWCSVSAAVVRVVDQSCIRLFHEGVAGWLRLGGPAVE
jgi:hypothetical protein